MVWAKSIKDRCTIRRWNGTPFYYSIVCLFTDESLGAVFYGRKWSNRYCNVKPILQVARRVCGSQVEINGWWKQPEIYEERCNVSMNLLKEMFPGRLISIRGDIEWLPRSPDLNPCDFYQCGYLEAKVFAQNPDSTDELKSAIRGEIESITPVTLHLVRQSFETCLLSSATLALLSEIDLKS